jgi:hypothetical protein
MSYSPALPDFFILALLEPRTIIAFVEINGPLVPGMASTPVIVSFVFRMITTHLIEIK